ncbi:MAG: hypothetical protein ACPLRJ_00530 [Infirmifilum uzonense]|uniref:Roadblock/LAMTOR2 domain-containing protein n=1 Tax=Infirmifilum uzonense TaxID=1550241 RepID=A0A0F7FHA0_9CREN|nr:hypothetical protein [Infirmifilum uzonense]AKG38184.1 hypothetical protein MA03_01230 [Infirmifilum uzonense]
MEEVIERVKLEVQSFLTGNPRYQGALIVFGGNVLEIGEVKKEAGEVVINAVNFIAATFKQLLAGSPRYFVAEGKDYGISYGKFGFDRIIILFYKNIPLGTAMYDVKNLAQKLWSLTG